MMTVFLWILAGLVALAVLIAVIASSAIAVLWLLMKPILIVIGVILVIKLIWSIF